MFTKFEQGNLVSETCEEEEGGDESNDNSIIPPLLSEEEMDVMDFVDESDDEPMCTDILEEIRDRSQSHMNVKSR